MLADPISCQGKNGLRRQHRPLEGRASSRPNFGPSRVKAKSLDKAGAKAKYSVQ
jgi:hypothetical protein